MRTSIGVAFLVLTTLAAPVVSAQPKSLDALLREAAMHEAKGDLSIARDLYAEAVVRYGYSPAHLHIANIHLSFSERGLALAGYEKFLELNPKSSERSRVKRWVRKLRKCDESRCRLLFVRSEIDGADVFVDRGRIRDPERAAQGHSLGKTPLLTELPTLGDEQTITVSAKTGTRHWMSWESVFGFTEIISASFPHDDITKKSAGAERARARSRPKDAIGSPSGVKKTGKTDVALLVGVQDYAFLPDVPGAARNLTDWERFLADDLSVPTVLTLRDQDATREEILKFARLAAKRARSGGRLWFVYVGHGAPAPDGDDGLLVGVDGQQTPERLAARGVRRAELLDALQAGNQAQTIIVLDACFSGRDRAGNALAKGTMPVVKVGERAKRRDDSTVILTAARSNELAGALPALNRPAFSYLLLGALRGWADDGDTNITTGEAVKFTRREIATIPGRQQTPQLEGSRTIVLTRGARQHRPDISKESTNEDEPSPQHKNPATDDGPPRESLDNRIRSMDLAR